MPRATVVASKTALKFLKEMLNRDFTQQAAGDGDSLDLGGGSLHFIAAPFPHWPDSMFTFLPGDGVLFTCDAFGCHFCGREIFNDLAGDISGDYKYYYDVIMSPFAGHVLEAVNKIKPLEFDIIAPSHGPVLRENKIYFQ